MPDPAESPQFDTGRLADEYMPSSADVLAEIQAAEAVLRAQYADRITRITVSPTLAAWLRRKLPAADPPLIPTPWAALTGIPIVEDESFVNGRLRIHRGDAVEDWFAVPAHDPKWLVQIKEPELPFPWSPHCTSTGSADTTR